MPIVHASLPVRVVQRLEAAESVDRWSARVQPIVAKLVGTGRRRDLLTGRWLGHAVHPAAVLAPLGCWIGAAVTDAVGGRAAGPVSRRLLGAGVIAAGPALASGAADWSDTSEAEQRVGAVHASLNYLALAAMASSWALRGRGLRRTGIVLSSMGLGSVFAAGFLGGHLAYVRGVGVSTTAFQGGPDVWTGLVPVGELKLGRPTEASIDGVGYVAVDSAVGVRVFENRCTHRGGPLADGRLVDGCIECPWHASRFSLSDGSVVVGPASVPQPMYETRVESGAVEIRRTELGALRRSSGARDR